MRKESTSQSLHAYPISKHLKVLSTAGLLTERMVGREHIFELRPESLREGAQASQN